MSSNISFCYKLQSKYLSQEIVNISTAILAVGEQEAPEESECGFEHYFLNYCALISWKFLN